MAGFCLDCAVLITELLDEDVVPSVVFLGVLSANVGAQARAAEGAAPFTTIERRHVSAYRLAHNLDLPYETARRHVARLVAKGAVARDDEGVLISPSVLAGPAADRCAQEVWAMSTRLRVELQAHGIVSPSPADTPDTHEQRQVGRLANEALLTGLKIATRATATDLVTALVFLAIYRANHADPFSDPRVVRQGLHPGGHGPEETWKPVTVYRLSRQMRLPYETVRRHAGILLGEGLCLKAPSGGLVIPSMVLDSEPMVAASTQATALLTQFITTAFGPPSIGSAS
jgi:DNA-binding transcriptional ArsR family regulator